MAVNAASTHNDVPALSSFYLRFMRYRLGTFLIYVAFAPLAIALAYWLLQFALGGPLRPQVYLAFMAFSMYCWMALWRGASNMLFGPTAGQSWRPTKIWRRKRRHVR